MLIKNATLLDVVNARLLPDHSVLIVGSKIAEVDTGTPDFTQARVIDAEGRVLMPGLCDAHVHVVASTPDFAELARWPSSYVSARASKTLRDMLFRGFTTVRDAGGADHGLAQAVRERIFPGPRLLFCGKAISQTGGHGDMRQPGEHQAPHCPCGAGVGRICDGVPEIRHACRDEIRKGATHLKLMASGGVSSPTDRIVNTQFAEDELAAAVQEADAAGIYCMAHAYTPRAIQRAIRAGVRSIEHGNLLDRETAQMIREAGAFLVPTLSTYDALAKEGVEAGLPPSMRAKLDEVLEAGLRALELAAATGVQLVYGSDLLGSMHRHQLNEFALRGEVQAPIDIIRSATTTAAALFNLPEQIGIVAPGAQADLLVVDGNPLEDLGVLQNPVKFLRLIVRDGEPVHCDL